MKNQTKDESVFLVFRKYPAVVVLSSVNGIDFLRSRDYVRLCNPSYLRCGTKTRLAIVKAHILGSKMDYSTYRKESLNDRINRRGNVDRIKGVMKCGSKILRQAVEARSEQLKELR